MSRLVRISAVVMVMILTLALSATTMAASDPSRPFKGTTFGIDSAGAPTCPGASWQYQNLGMAQLAHLGRTAVEVSHCTWFYPETMSGTFGPGTITFTAANGDQLVVADWGTFHIVLADQASYIDLHWQAISGTGRFEGATGFGTGSGASDLVNGTSTMTFAGTISY